MLEALVQNTSVMVIVSVEFNGLTQLQVFSSQHLSPDEKNSPRNRSYPTPFDSRHYSLGRCLGRKLGPTFPSVHGLGGKSLLQRIPIWCSYTPSLSRTFCLPLSSPTEESEHRELSKADSSLLQQRRAVRYLHSHGKMRSRPACICIRRWLLTRNSTFQKLVLILPAAVFSISNRKNMKALGA